jgi:hypothetical protein
MYGELDGVACREFTGFVMAARELSMLSRMWHLDFKNASNSAHFKHAYGFNCSSYNFRVSLSRRLATIFTANISDCVHRKFAL